MIAQLQACLGLLFQRDEPFLLQAADRGLGEELVTEVGERGGPPQAEGFRQERGPGPGSLTARARFSRSQFLTAREVARHMTRQRSGVIMSITAEPTPATDMGGFMAACAAVEALWRGLACELGPFGIRLVIVRSAGSPDTPGVQQVTRLHAAAAGQSLSEYQANLGSDTLMRRLPGLAEVADAATHFASDRAGAMTAVLANVTCGSFVDL